jgi:hypothetical protein
MSEILMGYVKIDKPTNMDICKLALLRYAENNGIGIWLGESVHKEEIVDEYRDNSQYLIFSIAESFEYENIDRLLWSDIIRDSEKYFHEGDIEKGSSNCSLKEDVAKIAALLRIMLSHSKQVDLFLGCYGCYLHEYKTKINISIDEFIDILVGFINHDDLGLKHFIIN